KPGLDVDVYLKLLGMIYPLYKDTLQGRPDLAPRLMDPFSPVVQLLEKYAAIVESSGLIKDSGLDESFVRSFLASQSALRPKIHALLGDSASDELSPGFLVVYLSIASTIKSY